MCVYTNLENEIGCSSRKESPTMGSCLKMYRYSKIMTTQQSVCMCIHRLSKALKIDPTSIAINVKWRLYSHIGYNTYTIIHIQSHNCVCIISNTEKKQLTKWVIKYIEYTAAVIYIYCHSYIHTYLSWAVIWKLSYHHRDFCVFHVQILMNVSYYAYE